MCSKVSFFKRLFGNVCFKSKYDELQEEFNKYKQTQALLIDGMNYDNEALSEKLSKTEKELVLAIDKLKFHNDLVEEHNSLRNTYNQLRAKFNERVTLVKPAKQETPNPVIVTEKIKDTIRRLKYTNKQSFSRIAKVVNMSEDEVKAIVANFTKDQRKP